MAEQNENNGKTSLKGMIQEIVKSETEVLQGVVKSVNPIKIQIVNDEKLVIGPNITYIPKHLTDYSTEVTVGWQTDSRGGGSGDSAFSSHSHGISGRTIITVHNSLQVGEPDYISSFNHGKQYYVLDLYN